MQLSERAEFLVECLDLPAATGVEDARWEQFQLVHLSDESTFRIENKSRQIAWSWTAAAEAVANAVLYGTSSQFQSINLDEAREKIRYARLVYENLQLGGLPKITQPDTTTALGFENGARILSAPGTPQRGKARFWIYFDEWAHMRYARENYVAALPILSKGGKFRGASSPMGASGLFWEIFTQSLDPKKYTGFARKTSPWWEVQAFCKNVKEALRLAPSLSTFERVEMFGTERLQALYANMVEEDFQQEYEALFVDETTAWITWEEIKAAQALGEGLTCFLANGVAAGRQAIDEAVVALSQGRIEQALAGGVDIGRTRNTTEMFFVGKTTQDSYPVRVAITLDNVEFDDQLDLLLYAHARLPIFKTLIDRNGLGMNLAENGEKRYPTKIEGVNFSQPNKVVWATDAKLFFQQHKVPIPNQRDLAYQIHSIKKIVTQAMNVVFDADRSEKHHADKFWGLALALAAVKLYSNRKVARLVRGK